MVKIIEISALKIPEIKVIKFARLLDHRGYFTEHYRKSDLINENFFPFSKDLAFVQTNESYSKKGVVRGLHFQWNPFMGKLVRTVKGHMVDLILDIRKGSETCGKIIAYNMPSSICNEYGIWIWVPPGFAHGSFFPEETHLEYFCTGEYNPECEAGISPLASDIDWSVCDKKLKDQFYEIANSNMILSEKDKNGLSFEEWNNDSRSENFCI